MITIGFTGHRDKLTDIQCFLDIEEMYPGATWIHGGAEGFDKQVAAVGQRFKKVEGETLIVIRPDYKQYLPKVAPLKRNEVIVERSQLLIACYDGRPSGGTFYTVNYALQRNVPIIFFTPTGM